MKIRIQRTLKSATNEILWGIAIKLNEGYLYCKFPIGYQSYRTKEEAQKGCKDLNSMLNKGAIIKYSTEGSNGVNAFEYITITPICVCYD